jgi:hypothetical protein
MAAVSRLVEFPLEGGGSILVETEEPEEFGGTVRAGRVGDLPEQAGQSFEAALNRIQPAMEAVVARLRGLSEVPDQTTVELGLKLSGTAGAIIASTSMEANIKVTLSWKR